MHQSICFREFNFQFLEKKQKHYLTKHFVTHNFKTEYFFNVGSKYCYLNTYFKNKNA